ncbi:MAG TPA: SDR family NAD(P)-dependent oxidoreductase [Steroidobacteraceae bacterium]|nr:SDR family NAD(P)-dependent oxidoreductase [Steroidobacteraceae bacterium]
MSTVSGKTVVVTGAAAGIGYECALAMAQRGATVVLSDINEAGLEEARGQIAAAGGRCLAHPCNVASEESVRAFAALVQQTAGSPDVLINNAGVAFLGPFEDTPVAQWRRIYDINVLGIVHCVQAFLPGMRAAGGPRKIVNVASLAGVSATPGLSAYVASKHAVVGLSESLAMELDGTELSVLVVCPGIIDTAIVTPKSGLAASISEEQQHKLQQYYHDHGCHPRVVASRVVKSVEADDQYLFVGPLARIGTLAAKLPPRLARRLTLANARKIGYI